MKTNKIPFDPKYIGQPEITIETKAGEEALFVGMSKFDNSKYIFEINCPGGRIQTIAYGPDGINPGGNQRYDLLIVPRPVLTKFQSTILEIFDSIITDYNFDISQSPESRLKYVDEIKKAFVEELGISREEIQTLEFVLDNDVMESENIKVLKGLLQKLKEYEVE
jgi:hypothetical protein